MNRPGEAGAEAVYVTLTVAGQLCGLPVAEVRDVLGDQTIHRIPLAPPEIAGSLNLRGRILTAIDVRRRLLLPPAPGGAARMAVVAERSGELYALLVDQVSEVLSLSANELAENPPTLGRAWVDYSNGIYRLAGRLMVVLDIGRLLGLGPH